MNKQAHVDLYDFLKEGTFDCIKPGQTKELILANFPEPDFMEDMGSDMFIWLYGNFELHFQGERLFLIWCDNFTDYDMGNHIELKKWIFEEPNTLTPKEVMASLNEEEIGFIVKYDPSYNVRIRIIESMVDLHFDYTNEGSAFLVAIGLSHEDFRPKFHINT